MLGKKQKSSTHSNGKWKDIFKSPQRSRIWTFCIVGAVIVVLLFAFIGSVNTVINNETNVEEIEAVNTDIETPTSFVKTSMTASNETITIDGIKECWNYIKLVVVKTIFPTTESVVVSLASGILGAALLNIVYRLYANHTIRLIKSLHYDDMLTDFFGTLEVLKGRVRKNEEIRAEFDVYKDKNDNIVPELYKIRLDYEYYTILKGNKIRCKFDRIYKTEAPTETQEVDVEVDTKNEEKSLKKSNRKNKKWLNNGISEYTSGLDKKLLKYNFYWGNDETGNFPSDKIDDDAYTITNPGIDHYKSELIEKKKVEETKKGRRIEYTFKISGKHRIYNKDDFSLIRFTVEFPMERESILFLNHEVPTENTELKVDYSKIKNETEVYIIPVTGSAAQETDNNCDEGIHYFRHKGWVTPKAGYVVAWWDKERTSQ